MFSSEKGKFLLYFIYDFIKFLKRIFILRFKQKIINIWSDKGNFIGGGDDNNNNDARSSVVEMVIIVMIVKCHTFANKLMY